MTFAKKISGLLAASLLAVPLVAASGVSVIWNGPPGVVPGGQLVKGSLQITQNGKPWNGAVFLNPIAEGSSYQENIQLIPQGGMPDTLSNGLPTAQAQGQAVNGVLPLRWTQAMSPGYVQMSDRPWVGLELGATVGPGVNIESPTTFQTVVPAVKSLTVSAQDQSVTSLAGLASVGNVPLETSCAWSDLCPSSVPLTLSRSLTDTPTVSITLTDTGPQQTDSLYVANENENVPSSNAVSKTITVAGTSTTFTVALPLHKSDYGYNNRWLIEATPASTAGHVQGMAAIYLYGTPKKPTTPTKTHSSPPATTTTIPVHVRVKVPSRPQPAPTPTANLNLTIPAQATVGKPFMAHLSLTGSHLTVSGQRIQWAVGPSGSAVPGATSTGPQGYTKDQITATQAGTATISAKGPDGSSVSGQVKMVAPKAPTPKKPTPSAPKKPTPSAPKKPKTPKAKTKTPPPPTARLSLTVPTQAMVGEPFTAHATLTGSHLSVGGQRIQWSANPAATLSRATLSGPQGQTQDTITADQTGTATISILGPDGSHAVGQVQVIAKPTLPTPTKPTPKTPKKPTPKTPTPPAPKKPTPKKPKTPQTKTPKKPTPKKPTAPTPKKPKTPTPIPALAVRAPVSAWVGVPIPVTVQVSLHHQADAQVQVTLHASAGVLSRATGRTNAQGQITVDVSKAPVGHVVVQAVSGKAHGKAVTRIIARPFPWWIVAALTGLLALLIVLILVLRRRRRKAPPEPETDPEKTPEPEPNSES